MNALTRLVSILSACICLACISACSSQGDFRQSTGTSVSLAENNYKIIKAGAVGKSTGLKLLGIIPLVSPNMAEAKAALYASAGETLTGRAVALSNQTEDRSSAYLVIVSIPSYTITADIVEFTDKKLKR